MGEARKRGTKAQRVAEGIAKRQAAEVVREMAYAEYLRTHGYRRSIAAWSMFVALMEGGAKS